MESWFLVLFKMASNYTKKVIKCLEFGELFMNLLCHSNKLDKDSSLQMQLLKSNSKNWLRLLIALERLDQIVFQKKCRNYLERL